MRNFLRHLYWNESENRPRSLWRVLVFLAVAAAIANPLVIALDSTNNRLLESSLINVAIAIGFVTALIVVARYFEKRPIVDYGLVNSKQSWLELAAGFRIGVLSMGLLVLCLHLTTDFKPINSLYSSIEGVSFGWAFTGQVLRYFARSVFEETVMRGFALITLAEFLRGMKMPHHRAMALSWGATSAMFGLMHLGNDGATLIGMVNLIFLGVAFGLPMVKTGRLSMAIGLHFGWNICMNCVFGLPNGGKAPVASVLLCENFGSEYLTGGPFGPEASLFGLVAILAMGGLTLWWLRRKE